MTLKALWWWVGYHALNFAHITADSPMVRVRIVQNMRTHDRRKPK